MSDTAPPRRWEPSPYLGGSDSDYSDSTSSYSSYSTSKSSSFVSSDSASSISSSGSDIRRRHRRRLRSRSGSPILKGGDGGNACRKPRREGILGGNDGTASFMPNVVLPSVLGELPIPMVGAPVFNERNGSGVLGTLDKPAGDWPCGVCSNINSQQRDDCYRCGCHYTESLLATPSYEVCVTRLPPDASLSAAEKALRRTAPDGCALYIGTDKKKSLVYAQFASVEQATKYLVSRRCLLDLSAEGGGSGLCTRLSFSLNPHPRPKEEDVAAEAARAADEAERESKEAALTVAGVPRFLWPHTWNPPSFFPSAEKHKAFLGTMCAYWEHLSEVQKRYYEREVKNALKQAVSSSGGEGFTSSPQASQGLAVIGGAEIADVGVVSTATVDTSINTAVPTIPTAVASLPAAQEAEESPQKAAGKTSHALDGLKKRLAERKSALRKVEAGTGCGAASAAVTQPSTPGSTHSTATTTTTVTTAPLKSGATPGAVPTLGSSGDFPDAPSYGLAQLQTWGGFPVPLQYATLADVPRSVELARVPMSVCERLLPPALLQVARAQFR